MKANTFKPTRFDTGLAKREQELMTQLDNETLYELLMTDAGERLITADEFATHAGVSTKALAHWRAETLKQNKLIGPPWCVIKVGDSNLIAYTGSSLIAFMKTYVMRLDVSAFDPDMAKVYDEEAERCYAEARAKREQGNSHMTFSGTSPTSGGAK